MVRYRRNFVPGASYFFTVTVVDRRSSVLIDNIDVLRHAFRVARRERPFTVDAVVVLPEHLHTVITLPDGDADFSGRWRRIKSLFSRQVSKRLPLERDRRGEYLLWQKRIWEHTIRDEKDYQRHIDYIHFNPVKHGLVSRVTDWPHSSFHRYVQLGVFSDDWAGDARMSSQGYGERIE